MLHYFPFPSLPHGHIILPSCIFSSIHTFFFLSLSTYISFSLHTPFNMSFALRYIHQSHLSLSPPSFISSSFRQKICLRKKGPLTVKSFLTRTITYAFTVSFFIFFLFFVFYTHKILMYDAYIFPFLLFLCIWECLVFSFLLFISFWV